ncbi:unannotated protein [freshwater metagenome]|uniref:Unannotated protein n=1 Tax=freshwater metagenome TaxID=449393 RepID=A0A6J6VKV1_9ZZZZ
MGAVEVLVLATATRQCVINGGIVIEEVPAMQVVDVAIGIVVNAVVLDFTRVGPGCTD